MAVIGYVKRYLPSVTYPFPLPEKTSESAYPAAPPPGWKGRQRCADCLVTTIHSEEKAISSANADTYFINSILAQALSGQNHAGLVEPGLGALPHPGQSSPTCSHHLHQVLRVHLREGDHSLPILPLQGRLFFKMFSLSLLRFLHHQLSAGARFGQ